jgi:hypothetical protein
MDKGKHPSIFRLIVAVVLVAGVIVPCSLARASHTEAAPGICKWDTLDMPGSVPGKYDILHGSEVNRIAVGSDGATIIAAVTVGAGDIDLYATDTTGIIWSDSKDRLLDSAMGGDYAVWDVAIAPDDPRLWAVVTSTAVDNRPVELWVTENAGAKWERTQLASATGNAVIGAIDISPDYGGKRDIAVGIRDRAVPGPFRIYVLKSAVVVSWNLQTVIPATAGANADILALKFSPSYVSDAALAVVYATATPGDTYYDVGLRDLAANDMLSWVFDSVRVSNAFLNDSPDATTIVSADLELPSDFSGDSFNLRRAYVSADDGGLGIESKGIFRIDDSTVYTLMDLGGNTTKRIGSIAYFGSCASGKLLAGEVSGYSCSASVPTWFTDLPTTCPIPCWFPSMKSATGAAGTDNCTAATIGLGNAQVVWSADGSLAYCATGASPRGSGAVWYGGLLNAPIPDDESAFSLSHTNSETWNQLGLIDTTITKFNDVAAAADGTTLYLASVNANTTAPDCASFDSVWRTTTNSNVASPLPVYPLGFYWERVYCRVTAPSCAATQTDLPLLRLSPDRTNGDVLFWAAQATTAQAWSADFGDGWSTINPRNAIQDFAVESSTILYNLSSNGLVQKMPYTGLSWSSLEPGVDSTISTAHMITAQSKGKVLVGADANYNATAYPAAISTDGGESFTELHERLPTSGNVHVAFDPDFDNNRIVYVADDSSTGTVYRGSVATVSALALWEAMDMMSATNGAVGSPANVPHAVGQYGLQLALTGAGGQHALYSVHAIAPGEDNSGVCRTLYPLDGMPKPGIVWDCLTQSLGDDVKFTLEPWSLKKCGCLTLDTDTTLYAIDARDYAPPTQGMLWCFTDCMAKKGPALITEDEMLIGCDPVSGRNQEVNLCWEQLCLADTYDIEIAKNEDFSVRVIDWVSEDADAGYLAPADVTVPCCYIPAGGQNTTASSAIAQYGNFECGHTYYWRVRVRSCVTGQIVRSPWSEIRSFTIKAGLPVRADYYGLKLLSPDNGCIGCPVKPASFSWAPFKDTTKYKFVLAKDAALTDVIAEAETTTAAYEYDGTLDYSANYFWRVMCVEPAPSDWSATFSFVTEPAPPPSATAAPGTTSFWDTLRTPVRVLADWMATIKFMPIVMRPAPLGLWVGIIISSVLAIIWIVSLVYIHRKLRR